MRDCFTTRSPALIRGAELGAAPASLRSSAGWPQGLWLRAHPRWPAPLPGVTQGLSAATSGGPVCSSLVGRFGVVQEAGRVDRARGRSTRGGGGMGVRTRPSRARLAASSQAPPTHPATPSDLPRPAGVLLLLPLGAADPRSAPCGGTGVGSRPLGHRPEREVPGPQKLTARLRLRPRAERCREARFSRPGFGSRCKITPGA